MNFSKYDVIVIGAGIVGAACALELSRIGLTVLVVEQNGIATGATSAGMGHLVLLDDSEAEFALARYSLQLWQEMAGALPQNCHYWRCGTVWVAANEDELRVASEKRAWHESRGIEAELLNEGHLSELEPNLRRGLAGGLLIPQDAAVMPAFAARYLLACAEEQGAHILCGKRVVRIGPSKIELSDGTTLSAGAFVIATGTDAGTLLPGLPVRARKGHILVADTVPHFARHQVIELGYINSTHAGMGDSVTFNVRQRTGSELLIGSSRQYDAVDNRVEPAILEQVLTRAIAYMPGLAKARLIESWAGFRASTPDGLPLIGRHPLNERLFVATGHEGLGVTMSLGTGRLIADEISGRVPPIDPHPYSPSRF